MLYRKLSFHSLDKIGEEAFRLKFVDCRKVSVPHLAGYYATSSARDVPPKSHYLREIFNILSKVDGGL